jgi:hypothetical protein
MDQKYVTSLELSKQLKEAGVKQESEFYWIKIIGKKIFNFKTQQWFNRPEGYKLVPKKFSLNKTITEVISAFHVCYR